MTDVERLDMHSPRLPDREGFTDAYYETLLARRIPFSMGDPFIFHVLTTVDDGNELMQIMSEGGHLVPMARAAQRWGQVESLILPRDIVAGDDHYLFTTPCNVFSSQHERARYNPAVAFRLSYVLDQAKEVGFRVHDLEPQYKMAEQLAGPDELGLDEEEWEDLSPEELQARHEEDIAELVREQIEEIAACGTQYDFDAVESLVLLYAEVCGSFRDVRGRVPEDDPRRMQIAEEARALFPECVQEVLSGDLETVRDLLIENEATRLAEDWSDLFLDLWGFPHQLLIVDSTKRPELLVDGELALCEAEFYRARDGGWYPVPEHVCRAGRRR